VRNITDVDDKIINRAKENDEEYTTLTERFIKAMDEDAAALNVLKPDLEPRATLHMPEIISMIETLISKSFAYQADNGDVFYRVREFKDYGKLSNKTLDDLQVGARVEANEAKQDPLDFVLWKMAKPDEPHWDSPWGKGRPGWHIECSVMSRLHLGDTLDIHGGGMDLKFPHHENEIAQSEAATGKKFANFWAHVGTLLVEGKKMSKSLGNIIPFDALVQKEFDPLALRYLCLTTHYRGELNFTWAGLEAAAIALERLYDELSNWDAPGKIGCSEYENKFEELISDDLNLPEAVALMWKLVKDQRMPTAARMKTLLQMDRVFGLKISEIEEVKVPEEVTELVRERERLRREDNWTGADELRKQIEELGFTVEDNEKGSVIKKTS
jgi:cysteinyl-tRNA synthetase